ncbi:MAG TPA: hypothetical protein VKP30_27165, partial [Polyangiaceae bacterium]|nr:hypothetical protein [Polyangiaceae bacterium]
MRPSRKLIWTSVGVSIALVLASLFIVPWLADRALVRAAQTKGWNLHTNGRRVVLRGIWFSGVGVEIRRDATLEARLGPVCLGWSSLFGSRRISVGAGNVRLSGTFEQLRRLKRAPATSTEPSNQAQDSDHIDVHHLSVEWRQQDGELPALAVEELELEKSKQRFALRIPLIHARHGATTVELHDVRIEPEASRSSLQVSLAEPLRVSAAEVAMKYDSSASATPAAGANNHAAPTVASAEPHSERALPLENTKAVLAGKGQSKPAAAAAANGQAAAKRELLPLLSTILDEAEQLRANLSTQQAGGTERVQRWLEQIPIGSSFEAAAFRVRLVDDEQKLDLGPWALKGSRQPTDLRMTLAQSAETSQAALAAELTVADRLEHARLRFQVGPIALPQLGITDGDFGLENIGATELKLDAFAEFIAKSGEISIESKGRVARLSLRQPFLARQTIKN